MTTEDFLKRKAEILADAAEDRFYSRRKRIWKLAEAQARLESEARKIQALLGDIQKELKELTIG